MNYFRNIPLPPSPPPPPPPSQGWPVGVPVEVAALFEENTYKVINAGFPHYSAQTIIEIIRWHHHLELNERKFKCNDHWVATLSRWFMAKHPEYAGFFFTRIARKVLTPRDAIR